MRGIGGRRDKNHGSVRDGLRACGYRTEDTADSGNGFGDLVTGAYGLTFIFEVKSDADNPNAKETPTKRKQREKREAWNGGPWVVVRSLEEALRVIWKHRGKA